MKIILSLLNFFIFLNIVLSQDIQIIDSIGLEICSTVKTNSNLSDREIITLIRDEHILPYLRIQGYRNQDSIINHILLRSERLCPEYSALAYRNNENNGNYTLLSQKPKTASDQSVCFQFFENNSFYYIEPNGDKVKLEIKDGYWIDNFNDNTYSKLKLIKTSNCGFDIQFIESNNKLRNKFSKAGDRYSYQILSYENDKYYMSVGIPMQEQYFKFILYVDK